MANMERRILALQTSGPREGVATAVGPQIACQRELTGPGRSAQTLAPAIRDVLSATGWPVGDVDLLAVAAGPGSFTGLRVGITTAKVLAWTTGAEIVGVHTLEVIAWQAPPEVSRLEAVIDAQRGGLYVGRFRRDGSAPLRMVGETKLLPREEWFDSLGSDTWVTGTALTKVGKLLPVGVKRVAEQDWSPRAETVARLAARLFGEGVRDDLWRLVPQYYRRSAAEEKAALDDAAQQS
jgi:tRNA threonylcarbamoyladenosine biosynthesis protein TsaB